MKSNVHEIASKSHDVEVNLYVIATRGKGNKEVYLKCSDVETADGRIRMEWTENIDEAYATFDYHETEKAAKGWFKNYTKWYVKKYIGVF